jgi:mRNA interferase MazF
VVSVRTPSGAARCGVVVSAGAYSARTGLAVVCPIIDKGRGYPFGVELPDGLRTAGVVLADRVISLDTRSWRVGLVCSLPDDVVTAVCDRLAAVVDLRRR